MRRVDSLFRQIQAFLFRIGKNQDYLIAIFVQKKHADPMDSEQRA
jgi:hypothetical protein